MTWTSWGRWLTRTNSQLALAYLVLIPCIEGQLGVSYPMGQLSNPVGHKVILLFHLLGLSDSRGWGPLPGHLSRLPRAQGPIHWGPMDNR